MAAVCHPTLNPPSEALPSARQLGFILNALPSLSHIQALSPIAEILQIQQMRLHLVDP